MRLWLDVYPELLPIVAKCLGRSYVDVLVLWAQSKLKYSEMRENVSFILNTFKIREPSNLIKKVLTKEGAKEIENIIVKRTSTSIQDAVFFTPRNYSKVRDNLHITLSNHVIKKIHTHLISLNLTLGNITDINVDEVNVFRQYTKDAAKDFTTALCNILRLRAHIRNAFNHLLYNKYIPSASSYHKDFPIKVGMDKYLSNEQKVLVAKNVLVDFLENDYTRLNNIRLHNINYAFDISSIIIFLLITLYHYSPSQFLVVMKMLIQKYHSHTKLYFEFFSIIQKTIKHVQKEEKDMKKFFIVLSKLMCTLQASNSNINVLYYICERIITTSKKYKTEIQNDASIAATVKKAKEMKAVLSVFKNIV